MLTNLSLRSRFCLKLLISSCREMKIMAFWLFMVIGFHAFVEGTHHVMHLSMKASVPSTMLVGQYKTGYHFQPPKHWINDPNGPMYFKGVYHLFYQYNPKNYTWGNIVWAHSVSTDLVNWKALKIAIRPTGPYDVNGCWSGSATILPGNKPVIFYTGIDTKNRQVQNVAFPKNISDPYLQDWVKPAFNPLIHPVEGINASQFRDPTTAWKGADGRWRLVVGSVRNNRGIAYLYRSKDFVHWVKAEHPLHTLAGTGMWECPDFYPVAVNGKVGIATSSVGDGVKHVMKVSLATTTFDSYTIGKYDVEEDRFLPETAVDNKAGLRYDWGNYYASKTFFDPSTNRRILWGWSNESDTVNDDGAKGWAGIQTIPRKIWLDESGEQLVQWPVDELETLRAKQVQLTNVKVLKGRLHEVSGILASKADVEVSFVIPSLQKAEDYDPSWGSDPQQLCNQKAADVEGGIGPFGLYVLASKDLQEKTAVFFRVFKSTGKPVVLMCHDPSKSSLFPSLYRPSYGGFVNYDLIKNKNIISLRTLIDVSVVESFGANGKTVMTSRVYPKMALDQNAHLYAFNNGAEDVQIKQLNAWEMRKPLMNEDQQNGRRIKKMVLEII